MKRFLLLCCGLMYVLVFVWGYSSVVAPAFSNAGFSYVWPGLATLGWVTVLSLVPLLVIPQELTKPSLVVIWWLYVSAYVPSMVMPVITLSMPDSVLFPLQMAVLGTMLLLCAVPHAKTLVIPRLVVTPTTFWWVFGLFWAGGIVYCLLTISFSNILANFALLFAGESEYVLRADYFTHIAQNGRAIAYLGGWLSRAFDPFLIAWGLITRRWWLVAGGLFGQLIYFGQTGAKGVVFALAFIAFVFFLYNRFRHRFGLVFLVSMVGLVTIATSVDLATHTAMLSTPFTRRALAGPGELTGFYFEHFSSAPHTGHNFSGTGNFQVYGPAQEIGLYYFGNVNVDANANFWAEGFAEFGITGIFAFGLLVVVMLWLFDSVAANHSLQLAVLLIVMQAEALSNSTPPTILVTHGGIIVGLLLYFSPPICESEQDLSTTELEPVYSAGLL